MTDSQYDGALYSGDNEKQCNATVQHPHNGCQIRELWFRICLVWRFHAYSNLYGDRYSWFVRDIALWRYLQSFHCTENIGRAFTLLKSSDHKPGRDNYLC
jgi:hypothetical protein